MSLVRNNGNAFARDPFAFARDFFEWGPLVGAARKTFVPTFDVKQTADSWVLQADVPGVDEKTLEIAVHDGVLTVKGHRGAEARKDGETYTLYERSYGTFERSFSLPDVADPEKIDAVLAAGVLTLTIGKRAEAKPRKIEIKK